MHRATLPARAGAEFEALRWLGYSLPLMIPTQYGFPVLFRKWAHGQSQWYVFRQCTSTERAIEPVWDGSPTPTEVAIARAFRSYEYRNGRHLVDGFRQRVTVPKWGPVSVKDHSLSPPIYKTVSPCPYECPTTTKKVKP